MKMAESESSLPANCRQRLDDYLDAIELALHRTTAARESRRSVIEMVEAQVIEMCCTNLQEDSTDEVIGQLFDRLDPPELYAEAFDQRETEPAPKKKRVKVKQTSGVSHLAITSVILLAAPLLFLVGTLFSHDLAPLFFITTFTGVVGAPVLSWLALRSIDQSNGRITGRSLAMISFYIVPVVLANGLVLGIGAALAELSILICVAVTMGVINAGAVWLIRYAIDRWFRSESNGVAPPNDVPITAGTAVG